MAMRILVFAVFFSVTVFSAIAEAPPDPDLPPIDPPNGPFRMMTHDDATTTSQCVGRPITPLCAMETEIACRYRGKRELCIIAMPERRDHPYFSKDDDNLMRRKTEGYRIIAALKLTEKLIPPPDRGDWLPGDVGITIDYSFCRDGICPPPHFTAYRSYVVRFDGDRWRLIFSDSNRVKFTKWPPPNVNWDESD